MHPLRGILLKVASVCVFVGMASLIKATAGHVPPGEAVFFRSFFAIPVIVIWLAMRRELHLGVRTSNPLGHFWRGLIGTTSMGLGFAGLGLLPLPEVTAIGYASPLLVVIFAAMFLNEKVGVYRLGAVALGMAGVLIVLSPRLTVGASSSDAREALGAIVVLGAAFFASLAQVFVRKLVATESTATIVFWFSVTASALSTITIFWGWVIPAPREAIFLIIAGLLGGVGQILLTSSYRLADASVIAPFEYTSMLLAIGVGFFVFGEVPTKVMLLGAAIIISAGVIIILREHYLGLERAKQRKAMTPSG
ncbi:MAG: DMT family transporter [Rhodobacteraceae bacterium]|jgi:drug/metabolite transporter (DMT)-like permease|nr:DMT family transporter [Paracoccaceae bacterium]